MGVFILFNKTRTSIVKKSLTTNNNNAESYDTTILNKEKKKASKLQQTNEELRQCATRIFLWQHQYIKHSAISKTGNVWKAYGEETRRLLSIGINVDKQHQTTKFAQSHFKKPRGDVKIRHDDVKQKFELFRIDQQTKIEAGEMSGVSSDQLYPIFHMNTIKHVIADLLHERGISLDLKETRTINKYFRRVLELSKIPSYLDRYDITGFMEHDF